MLTVEDIRAWTGHTAQDPYGETLGTIAGTMHDVATGTPEWLVLAPDGDASEGVLVPAGGALPTGRRIRVTPPGDVVRSAPRVRVGDEIDIEQKRAAAAHYGLVVDPSTSPTGQLRAPGAAGRSTIAEPTSGDPPAGPPERRATVVEALRAAHAMEQASLKLLAAMRRRMEDEELIHDVALHHKATNRHAERIRERLDELGAPRARPLDWLAKGTAHARAQLGRGRTHPDPGDLSAAHAFEQGEIAAYERLERAAREAGDERTAALASALRRRGRDGHDDRAQPPVARAGARAGRRSAEHVSAARPTDVEISRALNALSTTLRDQRPARLDPPRVQQIVDGALGHEPKLSFRPNGPDAGELRTLAGGRLVATVARRAGRWTVERKLRAGDSSWALPQPAHDEAAADER